jgi:predicted deacetylase
MSAQFLLRFDDICPTMNWSIWAEIEALLLQYKIRPILAVVPDNQDPKLMASPPVLDFWDRVRDWQACGWTIAMHGYQHVYVNGNRGLIGVTPQSEFAGLPRIVQNEKLLRGLDIFAREGVRADCWVAPSHSFDWTTVDLLAELGVRVISDGLWHWPHTDSRGVTWVPQQLWNRLRPMPPGVWTVCNHHSGWSEHETERFRHETERFASRLIGLNEAVSLGRKRRLTLFDRYCARFRLVVNYRLRPAVARLIWFRGRQ